MIIIFMVICVYEDDSSECMFKSETYEQCEDFIKNTIYEGSYFRIEKAFVKSPELFEAWECD